MMENILGIILVVLTMIVNLTFVSSFADGYVHERKSFAIIPVLCISLIIFAVYLKEIVIAKILCSIGVMVIASILLFKISVKKSILVNIICFGLFSLVEGIVFLLLQKFKGGLNYVEMNNANGAFLIEITCLMVFMVIIVLTRIILKNNRSVDMDITGWFVFLLFPVFSMFVTGRLLLRYDAQVIGLIVNEYIYISVGLLMINLIQFYLLENIVTREKNIQTEKLLVEKKKSTNDMFMSLAQEREVHKAHIHDYLKNLETILILAEKHNNDDQISFIKSEINKDIQLVDSFDTGNSIVNAVINYKFSEAQKKGITFPIVSDNLEDIGINGSDLVIILSNLIDNAIDAAKQCEDKKINLKLKLDSNMFYIDIANTYSGKILQPEKIQTSKKDKYNHGYGLKNVKRTVLQNNGDIYIDTRDNIFHVTIVIPLQ